VLYKIDLVCHLKVSSPIPAKVRVTLKSLAKQAPGRVCDLKQMSLRSRFAGRDGSRHVPQRGAAAEYARAMPG